jgi:hypothetical protein
MSDPAPERITVTYKLNAADYAHYAASVERRSRSWTAFNISLALFFCAIPVALIFRARAAASLRDDDAIEMVGQFTLYAFVLGIVGSWLTSSVINRIARRRYFATTVNSHEPRTAEIDRDGVTVTGKALRSRWEWAAITKCTFERGLLLIWIGPFSAVAIPSHCFASEAACAAALAFARARLTEAKPTDSASTPERA